MAVTVQAYENQQSWLDGSLDADAAMELLERDTDGPVALLETHSVESHQVESDSDSETQTDAVAETETETEVASESEDFPQVEERAPAGEALVEMGTEAEEGAEAETQTDAETEEHVEAPVALAPPAVAAPAPVAEAAPTLADIDLDAAMPMLMELHAASRAQAQAQAQTGATAQWANGPPRRRAHRRSIRAEREAFAQKRREDAIYAENLRKLRVRREKWSVPHHIADAVHVAQAHQLQAKGLKHDAEGFMTQEEAQVESLIQMNSKPMITLHHQNNVHGRLTPDLLHGTGLNNKLNRAATAAGLAASADNHPHAPAFIQLPPIRGQPAGHKQSKEYSFVTQKETVRPAYAGPTMAGLPQVNTKAPTVLKAAAAARAPPAKTVSEAEFVAGLPAEFMELDAATQVKILALVDAGVDVTAETEQKAQTKAKVAATTAATESKVAAKAEAKVESKTTSKAEVEESELADAASALKALAALQQESHVPFAKLVHLLAKGNKQ